MCGRGKTGSGGAATFAQDRRYGGARDSKNRARRACMRPPARKRAGDAWPAKIPAAVLILPPRAPTRCAPRVLFQGGGYAGEGGIEVGPKRQHGGDDGDGNACGDQAIAARGASAPELCLLRLFPCLESKGGRAPTGAFIQWPRHTLGCRHPTVRGRGSGLSGTRSPLGALPRRLSRRANAATQPRPRFTRAEGRRRYPRRQTIALKRSTSRTGRNAGGDDARTAGSGITTPARRNRTSPRRSAVTGRRPSMGEIRLGM